MYMRVVMGGPQSQFPVHFYPKSQFPVTWIFAIPVEYSRIWANPKIPANFGKAIPVASFFEGQSQVPVNRHQDPHTWKQILFFSALDGQPRHQHWVVHLQLNSWNYVQCFMSITLHWVNVQLWCVAHRQIKASPPYPLSAIMFWDCSKVKLDDRPDPPPSYFKLV